MGVLINRLYKHKKTGRKYKVLMLTNTETTNIDAFPITVVYQYWGGDENIWSRPLIEFEDKFDLVPQSK